MQKIFYDKDGWVCQRYPHDIPIDDETRFIEVDDDEYEKTFSCPCHFSWRVVNNLLTCEQYEDESQEELDVLKISALKVELEKIKEDIEQETFGLVRDDFAEKKLRAAEIVNELRMLEGKEPRDIKTT